MEVADDPTFDQQATEVIDRVADILMLLSDVAAGDYSMRLETDLPENHPLGALYLGINEMIESLGAAQERTAAYQAELEEKLRTIEQQRTAIRELSTPIIEVWESVLCLPVVGVVDSVRSSEMTQELLDAVVEKKSRFTIIDITGIEVMDTGAADHFIRMARSVQLLGAQCVLTGINPRTAQTIVHLGVDLGNIITYRTMRDALQAYVRSTVRQRQRERELGTSP